MRVPGLLVSIALGCALASAAPDPPTAAANVRKLLDAAADAFPRSKVIRPDEFIRSAAVRRLVQAARGQIAALLAEGHYHRGMTLIVENPLSFEQFKKRQGLPPLRVLPDPRKRVPATRQGYEQYLARWRERDERRGELEHRRRLIAMVVGKIASRRPQVIVELLEHKEVVTRRFAISVVGQDRSLRDPRIVRALLNLLPDRNPWNERPGGIHGGPLEPAWQVPLDAVEVLSQWRVAEAVPYIRRLADDSYFHYRAGSIRLMNRYGVQRSVPLSIHLLGDRMGWVRARAFMNLVVVTGVSLGQHREFWADEKAPAEGRAEAARKWAAWWQVNGEGKDEETFHCEVAERALRLMEQRGLFDPQQQGPIGPYGLLDRHVDISRVLRTGMTHAQKAAALRRFWRQNRSRARFDPRRQKLVVDEAKGDPR